LATQILKYNVRVGNIVVNNLRLVSMEKKKIDDELLAALMLKGLTKEYYPMRMVLENSNIDIYEKHKLYIKFYVYILHYV
jgi:hypothetical protein